MDRKILLGLLLTLFISPIFSYTTPTVSIKSTSNGIVSKQSATIIFDVSNQDMDHSMEARMSCISPDGVTVAASLGSSQGTGGQYISPVFTMEPGTIKAITLTIASTMAGMKYSGCTVRYVPFLTQNGTKQYYKPNLGEYVPETTGMIKDPLYNDLSVGDSVEFTVAQFEIPEFLRQYWWVIIIGLVVIALLVGAVRRRE